MLQPLLETSTQGSGLTPEQYISLLQTMIRSALSAVAFVVAIFLFLVKEYRDDCERHKSTTRQASERISFAIWVLRMIVHLKVVYAVLVLLAIPSLIVVGLMMAGYTYIWGFLVLVYSSTVAATALLLLTVSDIWRKRKLRNVPNDVRLHII